MAQVSEENTIVTRIASSGQSHKQGCIRGEILGNKTGHGWKHGRHSWMIEFLNLTPDGFYACPGICTEKVSMKTLDCWWENRKAIGHDTVFNSPLLMGRTETFSLLPKT